MTVTEALAEIKTIVKRIASKREFIVKYLYRVDVLKDPLEKDGGSKEAIEREQQAIRDLEQRIVDLRRGIQTANEETKINIGTTEKSIADWLVWRREVAPGLEMFQNRLSSQLAVIRDTVKRQASTYNPTSSQTEKPADVVVNISEQELASNKEYLDSILGQLDGQLSLKNATISIVI
jgi:hypothetical protein